MKRLLTALISVLIFPLVLIAQEPVVIDTTLIMSDGIALDAFYVLPTSAAPGTGYPAILSVHGFGGNKNNNRGNSVNYAKQGYVATAYSVRGQGNSGGLFDFFNSFRIIDDLKEMIAFSKALPGVNPERLGVIGGSQGGLHAWAAACFDLGVRAVVSMIANGRLMENWVENNAMNYTFAGTISGTPVNMAPHIRSTVDAAIQSNNIEPVEEMLEGFTTIELEKSTTTPVMMMFSYYDQYFNPSSGLRQFNDIAGPKKVFTYPAKHSGSSSQSVNNALGLAAAVWFEYWLKDNQAYAGIVSIDSALVMYDGADNTPHYFSLADTGVWLNNDPELASVKPLKLYFSPGTMTSSPGSESNELTFSYVGGLGGQPIVLYSEPLEEDLLLTGTSAYAYLFTNGTANRYQVNIEIADYNPIALVSTHITRGHYQLNDNASSVVDTLVVPLNAVMHTIKAGHSIEVKLHGGKPVVFTPINNEVLGTGRTSINIVHTGAGQDSYIQLFSYDPSATSLSGRPAPTSSNLNQNYPNPFGAGSLTGANSTTLAYETTSASATLSVYNRLGRRIAVLHDKGMPPGAYSRNFDAAGLPGGLYFAVLQDGSMRKSIPMVVLH
jgi:predicted acyl esterase